MRIQSPWAFIFLFPFILLLIKLKFSKNKASIKFPATTNIKQAGLSLKQRLLWIPRALLLFILLLLILAISRPQQDTVNTKNLKNGIAIEMIIDSSSSMDISMRYDSINYSRFEIAKKMFMEFINGNNRNLTGRTNDLIGMITFARYADTICPLTLDHGTLTHFTRELSIENRPNEDGTAIGDALILGAGRLKTIEDTLLKHNKKAEKDYEIKSKIIILLTDGENNCGRYMPHHAALLAKKWGIKIYAIGFGNQMETKIVQTQNGPKKINITSGFNTQTLARVADITGGMFRVAKDADALREIYKEIDLLEKSEIKSLDYLDQKELYIPFALIALSFLLLETISKSLIFRKIP